MTLPDNFPKMLAIAAVALSILYVGGSIIAHHSYQVRHGALIEACERVRGGHVVTLPYRNVACVREYRLGAGQ